MEKRIDKNPQNLVKFSEFRGCLSDGERNQSYSWRILWLVTALMFELIFVLCSVHSLKEKNLK